MKSKENELEELLEKGWEEAGEIPCGGCDRTATIYQSPDEKGQVEDCPDCGLRVNA